ncbi:MAG: FapA family protein [Campylobacter sp.]|nr:FapA family protein [Campylobacter sp.]
MSDEKISEPAYFTSITVQTKEPLTELKNHASARDIDPNLLDYHIVGVFTTYTNEANKEPVSVKSEELNIFDDDAFFADKSLVIDQTYSVEIYDVRLYQKPAIPKISVGVNKDLTKAIAKIHASQNVKYSDKYDELLYEYIIKQLIKAKLLVGIRESKLKQDLGKISSIIRIKEKLEKDLIIGVSNGVAPISPTDAQIVYHYDEEEEISEEDKINYADRGFLQGVVAGEVIIEKIKPKNGKSGRNLRGEFIDIPPAKEEVKEEIKVGENIEVQEDDESIKYIAKKPGFVSESGGVFDIKEEYEVNEINFRQTGSVLTGLDSNVSLRIKENDIFKDAIGTGMTVEAKEVDVKGNVAANAKIIAEEVTIGGQTHGKSFIKAQYANIAVHIGRVEAEEVEIDRLEGGSVVGKRVKLNSVIGGNITAEEVIINTLGSNCTITAALLIDVKNLRGSGNKFIMDTSKMHENAEEIPAQLKKISEIEHSLKRLPREIEAKKIIIETNKSSIYNIKQKVVELQKAKIAPPVTFMKKLKEYQRLVNDYNNLLKKQKNKKALFRSLKEELDVMQNGIFAAKVINRGSWKELNEIKFIIIDPPSEVSYTTRQNEIIRVMSLKRNQNGEFVIKKSNDASLLE